MTSAARPLLWTPLLWTLLVVALLAQATLVFAEGWALIPFAIAVAALICVKPSRRSAVWLILGFTIVFQVVALTRHPQTSNDDLRYIWDGKVQLAGVDPYRYVPNDPALVRLHERALFTDQNCSIPTGCALLNRPGVHTVYPPVAQASFDVVRLASFGGRGGQLAFQIAAALGVLVITALLIRRSRLLGQPPWWVALWGWNPIVVAEFGNNAHIDWVGILLSIVAISAYVAMKPRWAGALLGAAIATKLYPALIAPALMRRNPVKVAAAAAVVIVLGYIPHLVAVGSKVIGYFPGYLSEEGYDNGSRLVLISWVLPHPYDTVAGVLLMLGLALLCLRVVDPERPELSAVWLMGAAFLIFSPNYGWYATLLVALIAMTGRWHWLPVACAPTFTYLYAHSGEQRFGIYLVCAITTVVALTPAWRGVTAPSVTARSPV